MLKKFYDKESSIHASILEMGTRSHQAITKSIKCYQTLDGSLAKEVIDNDYKINDLKSAIEEECIRVIARQQPVAHDLRVILSAISIASELERIADYATSIAKIIIKAGINESDIDNEVIDMANLCLSMLTDVMEDYDDEDEEKANSIAKRDDEIDAMETNIGDKLLAQLTKNADNPIACTHHLWIIHQLERMGDRITNIAEKIVFIKTGKLVNLD